MFIQKFENAKNFFRQKKLSQKKFLAEKNVRDFFTNFKIKKI